MHRHNDEAGDTSLSEINDPIEILDVGDTVGVRRCGIDHEYRWRDLRDGARGTDPIVAGIFADILFAARSMLGRDPVE